MAQVTIYTCDKCSKDSKDGNFLLNVTLMTNKNWQNGIDHYLCLACQRDIVKLFKDFVPNDRGC